MKKYILTQDFVGYKKEEILAPCIILPATKGYQSEKGYGYIVDQDIINALPEIFKPVPQKKTVYIAIWKKPNDSRKSYSTSCAYLSPDDLKPEAEHEKIYPLEIEVDE